eukprot:gene10462-biopygen15592
MCTFNYDDLIVSITWQILLGEIVTLLVLEPTSTLHATLLKMSTGWLKYKKGDDFTKQDLPGYTYNEVIVVE